MDQTELFHGDIYEAMDTDIKALGGYKAVGVDLWPELGVNGGYKRLKSCTDADGREVMRPATMVRLMALAALKGHRAMLTYICRESNHSDPVPVVPEEQVDALLSEFLSVERDQRARSERIERLLKTLKGVG